MNRNVANTFLTILAFALSFVSVVHASTARIWLDFDDDGRTSTINSVSTALVDTATVLYQPGSEPLSGDVMFLVITPCGARGVDEYDPEWQITDAVDLRLIDGSCEELLVEESGYVFADCNNSCGTCRPEGFWIRFKDHSGLPGSLRYPIAKVVTSRGAENLDPWAYLELAVYWERLGIVSNEIEVQWETPIRATSWGELKRHFRSE
ncbi:MAG: hypothetical protein KDA27_26545 [Candidatus Eisenbacteria bacterium]|uniref:Uncharacterized protein n=1 Tax=Eiseniibacteriota bacterium TaxID=2212470 RepID=A0A956SGK6_UNCEI|nr:hypothetical protein [Candidatus Eisenbacteria bacterium]MCB9465726.1 hypothetical protein [Candidatus Eisenbacteria bacterium]